MIKLKALASSMLCCASLPLDDQALTCAIIERKPQAMSALVQYGCRDWRDVALISTENRIALAEFLRDVADHARGGCRCASIPIEIGPPLLPGGSARSASNEQWRCRPHLK